MCQNDGWGGRPGPHGSQPHGHRVEAWKTPHGTIWILLAGAEPAGQRCGRHYSPPSGNFEFCSPRKEYNKTVVGVQGIQGKVEGVSLQKKG